MSSPIPKPNFLEQKPPEELFHYTSMVGLMGMVAGKAVWATNIEFLNDSTEFKHGEQVVTDVTEAHKRQARGDRKAFFDELDGCPSFFQAEDVFVVSLSEARDLLSQWRGYTPTSCGFSVGFDADGLSKAAWALHSMKLVRCVYTAEDQELFARSVLEHCLGLWDRRDRGREKSGSAGPNVEAVFAFRIYSTFMAASMKHQAFAEEQEWRLLGICRERNAFKFRAGKSALTPYVELKWGKDTKAPDVQPIRSVTVGPCPDPQLSMKSVKRLLDSHDAEGVSVMSSEIPFRTW